MRLFPFKTPLSWTRLFTFTLLSACAYVFMEWLFIVTKPSFMNVLSPGKKAEILFFTAGLLAVGCALALLLPWAASLLLPGWKDALIALSALVPAGLLGALALLMIDNFTYTVFHFGIATSRGLARGLYALLLLGLVIYAYRSLLAALSAPAQHALRTHTGVLRRSAASRRPGALALPLLAGLLAISLAVPLINGDAASKSNSLVGGASVHPLTHVILITSDGVDATRLSLYGAARDTTPRLKALAASSLVVENAFANANKTDGSIISLYTGKYPSQTRLLYPPDILRGADAYEHLPGILHAAGYHTVQITTPHYVDAFTANVLEGFDIANGQTASTSRIMSALNQHLSNDFAYFIYELGNRLFDRVRHVLYIKEMKTSLEVVTNPLDYSDADRLEGLLKLFNDPRQPVFVHIHLLGTHGDKFFPDRQIFSTGKSLEDQALWDDDLYDDAIRQFDGQVGGVVDALTRRGLLDHSLLIIGSDHGEKGITGKRVPLLIRFPNGEHAGRLTANAQNLDIAPTVLDYLGLPIPAWMSGQSLLRLGETQRPIITYTPSALMGAPGGWILDPSQVRPPFYQLGQVVVMYCQTWYQLDLVKKTWTTGQVAGSTDTCAGQPRLTDAQILQVIVERLKKDGFDTRSLAGIQLK